MTKVELDGKVAVLIRTNFGAGWSTSADPDERDLLLFDPDIVDIVLDYNQKCAQIKQDTHRDVLQIVHERAQLTAEMTQAVQTVYTLKQYKSYVGDMSSLCVIWIPKGVRFIVHEYDGKEHVEFHDNIDWITA